MPAYSRILLPWDSQPHGAVEIARDSSLTSDLALLINPGAGFYDATGQRTVTPNGVSIAASSAGLAFAAASNASAGASFAKSRMATSDGAGTGDFSILVVGNPVASATREMLFSITNGTTEFYFAVNSTVGLVASSGVVSPQTNAGGAVGVAQSGGADGRMHAWLYVREAVAVDFGYLYCDGVLVGSGSLGSPNAAVWSSTSADNVGGWSGANWGISQRVAFVAGWNRVVSQSEAELLTRSVNSPYQLFAPRSIWVPVSAATSGAYTLTADAAAFTLAAQDATLIRSRIVTADAASFAVAAQDATLLRGRVVTADASSFALAAQDATITKSTPGVYTLTCDAAQFDISAQSAELTYSGATVARRHAGGYKQRKGYLIKGRRYFLSDDELAVHIAHMLQEVSRGDVKEITAGKPKVISKRTWDAIKPMERLNALSDMLATELIAEDDDEETLLMLM